MTDATVAKLVEDFQLASARILRLHRKHAGDIETVRRAVAYVNNYDEMSATEAGLHACGQDLLAACLRLEHELVAANMLAARTDNQRGDNLRKVRTTLRDLVATVGDFRLTHPAPPA